MQIIVCCVCVVMQVRPVFLECDRSKNLDVHEGNIGDVDIFSWVGVLRTKIFTATENKVALTGIVLVRDRYCIGHADDVARISKRNMADTTKAMFIPMVQKPWYAKVKDYVVHPEYDYSAMNTIALIELDLEYVAHVPVTPICWPLKNYKPTDLYVIGYTDENKLLEKMLYKVNYVAQDACKEFYERQQPIIVEKVEGHNSICAVAPNNKKNCEWDNGMVMASNSTGIWTLIGFSLQGPSCSAPSRFLDLTKYLNWIETTSTLETEDNIYRKSGGDSESYENYSTQEPGDSDFSKEPQYNTLMKSADVTDFYENSIKKVQYNAFRKPGDVTEFHEDHAIRESVGSALKPEDNTKLHEHSSEEPQYNAFEKSGNNTAFFEVYGPKDNDSRKSRDNTEFNEHDSNKANDDNNSVNNFRVQRIACNAISINFNTTADSGDCTTSKAFVYSETMPLRSNKTDFSTVLLKIPIIDLVYKDYSCISLEVKPRTNSTYLWYNLTRKNFNKLQKTVSNEFPTFKTRNYKNKHPSAILYLKLKFVFDADFKYLVYDKKNTGNIKKDNSVIDKVLSKLNNNIKPTKVSAKFISKKKVKPRINNANSDKNKSQLLAKRNVKIFDHEVCLKELSLVNLKKNKISVPFNRDDDNINSIRSIIHIIYNNYVAMNVFIALFILSVMVCVLLSVFIRKGYVRL